MDASGQRWVFRGVLGEPNECMERIWNPDKQWEVS